MAPPLTLLLVLAPLLAAGKDGVGGDGVTTPTAAPAAAALVVALQLLVVAVGVIRQL